jgi:hypothetical protein
MKNLSKYLLVAAALVAYFILTTINQRSGKSGPCCPFSIKQTNLSDGVSK